MEIWKLISGSDGYEASNCGNIRGIKRKAKISNGKYRIVHETILKPNINGCGYKYVQLGRKNTKTVHRLIALTFIENPDSKEFVNHKDGNKLNNHIDNLEWVTRQENEDHAFRTGLKNISGENAPWAKLNNQKVIDIRSLRPYWLIEELGQKYNVSGATIDRICNRRTWTHI